MKERSERLSKAITDALPEATVDTPERILARMHKKSKERKGDIFVGRRGARGSGVR